jgi:hypothetical protein
MDYVLGILKHSESVLAKKIKGLKDGKPKWAANEQMTELREAIKALQDYEKHMQQVPDGWHNAWPDMPVGH